MMEQAKPSNMLAAFVKIFGFICTVGTLIAALYGFHSYVNSSIEKKINDADFLSKIAARVRPSAIFDGKGSILADMGAMQYLQRIDVPKTDYATTDVQIVVVFPKHHLSTAPLISNIDRPTKDVQIVRGSGFTWVFTFKYPQWILWGTTKTGGGPIPSDRYRIEIIH